MVLEYSGVSCGTNLDRDLDLDERFSCTFDIILRAILHANREELRTEVSTVRYNKLTSTFQ